MSGFQSTLEGVCCKHCGSGPIHFREDVFRQQELCTFPVLYYLNCTTALIIPFYTLASSKALAINRGDVLAKCGGGGSYSSLEYLFVLLDVPPPVSRNIHSLHLDAVCDVAVGDV